MYTLTLIDVRQVQHYLFNANELRQNLGASLIVEKATHEWIISSLPEPHNLAWDPEQYESDFLEKNIEDDQLAAEVIFLGGGNALIIFDSKPKAVEFTRAYTQKVLLEAPGLEVAVGHAQLEWDKKDGLEKAWNVLQNEIMPERKRGRVTPQILPGLSVTAECGFTSQPAVEDMQKLPGQEAPLILVSAEVLEKRSPQVVQEAKNRLDALIPSKSPFVYPDELSKLGGQKHQSRYIAVVHADGNNMGNRIKSILEKVHGNRERVEMWRKLSQQINLSGLMALRVVIKCLRNAIVFDSKTNDYVLKDQWNQAQIRYQEASDDDVIYLPIRPIIFGGDDVTFVCEGRLGITLAVKFLEAFNKQDPLPDGKCFACAGVAIVHQNYPFVRAYKLAEALARSAKQTAKEYDSEKRVSLVHWHISSSGLTLDWEDIHRREYLLADGDLLLRPLIVNKRDDLQFSEAGWRTWDVFIKTIEAFRADENWKNRRSKQKELRETLRLGENIVKEFTEMHGNLPAVIEGQDADETGWYGGRCVYFDALDADDWLIYPQYGQEDDSHA
jgi:uncharacterized protein YeeX (DUF496 family)